jgi:hypothetical protein
MRLAFVSQHDPADVRSWSGIPYHVSAGLTQAGVDVVRVVSPEDWGLGTRLRRKGVGLLGRGAYKPAYDREVLKRHRVAVGSGLRALSPDVAFGTSVIPFAGGTGGCPIVLWPDATFALLRGYLPAYTGLWPGSVGIMDRVEREVLGRAELLVFPSRWAADSACEDYGVDPSRVALVAYGANLPDPGTAVVAERRANGAGDRCRLLAVGVEWERKGMAVAAAAAGFLERAGVPATLTIAGCAPPAGSRLPDNVHLAGFVDKTTPEGSRRLARLFLEADVFILPTVAEPFGIVFAEAAEFGLPVVTTRTGGIPDAVVDGVTGRLLPPEADAAGFAAAVQSIVTDGAAYARAAASARAEYERRLNWSTACAEVAALLERVTRAQSSGAGTSL